MGVQQSFVRRLRIACRIMQFPEKCLSSKQVQKVICMNEARLRAYVCTLRPWVRPSNSCVIDGLVDAARRHGLQSSEIHDVACIVLEAYYMRLKRDPHRGPDHLRQARHLACLKGRVNDLATN